MRGIFFSGRKWVCAATRLCIDCNSHWSERWCPITTFRPMWNCNETFIIERKLRRYLLVSNEIQRLFRHCMVRCCNIPISFHVRRCRCSVSSSVWLCYRIIVVRVSKTYYTDICRNRWEQKNKMPAELLLLSPRRCNTIKSSLYYIRILHIVHNTDHGAREIRERESENHFRNWMGAPLFTLYTHRIACIPFHWLGDWLNGWCGTSGA